MAAGEVQITILDGTATSRTVNMWSSDGTVNGNLSPLQAQLGVDGATIATSVNPLPVVVESGAVSFSGSLPAGANIIGQVSIDQTTDGTTNAVHLKAGTAIAGKFGIDQTTDGTTNAVHLTAGTNLAGKFGIDQTTPGTTNGVQVNAALPAGTNLVGKMGIDQTTPGTTNGVTAAGVSASGATLTENPLAGGGRAATTWPTAVTDGQKVANMVDTGGRQVTKAFAPSALDVRGYGSATNNAATTIIAASGSASLKTYVTALQAYNTSATTITITLSDSASTVLIVPAGGGNNITFPTPLVTAANAAFTFTASTGETTIGVSAQGYSAP